MLLQVKENVFLTYLNFDQYTGCFNKIVYPLISKIRELEI